MEETHKLIEQRKEKLQQLMEGGHNPFMAKFSPSESCSDAKKNYEEGRETKWTVIFNKQHDQWGAYRYDASQSPKNRISIYPVKVVRDMTWTFIDESTLAHDSGYRICLKAGSWHCPFDINPTIPKDMSMLDSARLLREGLAYAASVFGTHHSEQAEPA